MLEEDVAVLVAAAHGGALGVQGVGAEGVDGIKVAHLGQVLVVPGRHLLDLVGGPEAVEEVDEGHLALDGGEMGHGSQVHDLLGIVLAEHGEAGLAAGHDVGVIAEDVQRVGGNGAGGHVEHAGQLLRRDLKHVGDHQQQALGRRIGGGQGAGSQGAVDRAGSAGLRLHLHDLDPGAEDVLAARGGPLVHQVSHGGGRRDGVDARHLGERVADIRCRVVAVHGMEFSCHYFYAS